MSFFSIISLLFLGNLSSEIEKENTILKEKIKFSNEQFNINQIEYSLVTNYDYLLKLRNIYIEDSNIFFSENRITYNQMDKIESSNIFTVSIK
jgi:hypothetical protein|tara:strand:+ start:725 stop:1003 length:279 start_codon:yes stop_codon:yes gene_type:complete